MQPLVSVIIPCFNCARYIPRAINSVLSQTFCDFECIVVDDGSTDNTRQITEGLMNIDSRVKYLFKKHGGVSAARNSGIKHAKGKWIQQLDADDFLHKDKIRFQLGYLSGLRSQNDVVFYSDYEVIWEDNDHNLVRRITNIVGDLTSNQLLERIMEWSFQANIPLHSNNVLFKKSVFKTKMYNETFFAFEDLELFVDLLLKKVSFIYTPIVGMTHRIHESNMTKDMTGMRCAYIQYLEAVHDKDKKLMRLCPNMGRLVNEAIIARDKKIFDRLIKLIRLSEAPVCFSKRKISINGVFILKVAYFLRLDLPSDNEEIITIKGFFRNLKRVVRALTSYNLLNTRA